MRQIVSVFLMTLCLVTGAPCGGSNKNEKEARKFLKKFDKAAMKVMYDYIIAGWKFETNMTDYNQEQMIKQGSVTDKFLKEMRNRALEFDVSAMSADTKRQFGSVTNIGTSAELNDTKVIELSRVMTELGSIYSKAKVCLASGKCLPLDPDITEIIAKSRDYDELLQMWVKWRDESGKKMKSLYTKFVELSNEAVSYLGFADTGAMWRATYESDNFVDVAKDVFKQVLPLYQQLHAYARKKLKNVYGENRFPKSGHIPAHILGNMWGQSWSNINDLMSPYKDRASIDITEELIRQNYTVNKIFKVSEDFFVSLGFDPMLPGFWKNSMLERPRDGREVVCHASATDFCDQKDFRVKMCTSINQEDFIVVHHEMGHIEYYMQYKNQPLVYRNGANDGFHEAVGDMMTLSVQTPEHLYKLGLIKEVPQDEEGDINFLMNMALQKIAFLPFSYLVDLWRWNVFSGQTTPDKYNTEWWRLRCELQGLSPPVPRSEEDFDPGAKFHIPSNTPYLRYFISYIVQFQFHKAACEAAGHTGPLHRCDIYGNKAAGDKFRRMLSLGSSKPWPVAMQQLTGQDKMDAGPLLEYFEPLHRFLRQENGDDVGWDPACSQ